MKIKLDNKYIILLLIFILSIFASCLINNYDFDLFARLEVGEIFLNTGKILKHDIFSYTPTHIWYDHEWGSGVIFYAFLKLFGAFGLIILNALLLTGTLYFILKQNCRKTFPLITTFLYLGGILIADGSLIRCQGFSFLFTAVFLFLLEKYRKSESNTILLLPILVIIWNNLHGGVVSGLGIIFIYTLGMFLQKKPVKKLLISLGTSLLSLIINPYGIKYLFFLFYAATLKRYYIAEWYDVFQQIYFLPNLPLLILLFILIALKLYSDTKKKSFDLIQYTVLAVTLYMGLAHVKLLGISLVTTLCYCSVPDFKYLKHIEKSLAAVIIALGLLIPISSPLTARANFGVFPLQEIEFIRINDIKGNIVVSFELGSYTSYKLYPNNLIYMDGRYEEVYPPELLDKLHAFYNGHENWKELLYQYPPDIIICEKSDKLYSLLSDETDWIKVYQGYFGGVFIRKDNMKSSFLIPPNNIYYYRKTLFDR